MKQKERQRNNWNEKTGEKPCQPVPIGNDKKSNVADEPSDAPENEQTVAKHNHPVLATYSVTALSSNSR